MKGSFNKHVYGLNVEKHCLGLWHIEKGLRAVCSRCESLYIFNFLICSKPLSCISVSLLIVRA